MKSSEMILLLFFKILGNNKKKFQIECLALIFFRQNTTLFEHSDKKFCV